MSIEQKRGSELQGRKRKCKIIWGELLLKLCHVLFFIWYLVFVIFIFGYNMLMSDMFVIIGT
jgi:hypothetical protein